MKPEDLGFEAIPNLEKVLFKLDKDAAENMGDLAAQHAMKEKVDVRLDNLNLLYVAFTRAKQRLYVLAKQSDGSKPNVISDFLSDGNRISIDKMPEEVSGVDVQMYRYGDADFHNPKALENIENKKNTSFVSNSADWMARISVDADPSVFWSSDADWMHPNDWGQLVHGILSEIKTVKDVDAALQPYLLEGTINQKTADRLKSKFMQMAQHPLIGAAFSDLAKVKNECEILYNGEIKRPDRYAELPDVIYLLDYKTGKKSDDYKGQLNEYVAALKCLTDKEIRAYLVYLSKDVIEVEKA